MPTVEQEIQTMLESERKAQKGAGTRAVLVLLLVCAFGAATAFFSVAMTRAAVGPGGNWSTSWSVWIDFAVLVLLSGFPVAYFLHLIDRPRLEIVTTVVSTALSLCIVILGSRIAGGVRGEAVADLKVRMQPAIAALSIFHTEKGFVPSGLDGLVPEYLPSVPPGIPDFRITAVGDMWMLSFSFEMGLTGFESVQYLSGKNKGWRIHRS